VTSGTLFNCNLYNSAAEFKSNGINKITELKPIRSSLSVVDVTLVFVEKSPVLLDLPSTRLFTISATSLGFPPVQASLRYMSLLDIIYFLAPHNLNLCQ